MGNNKFEYTRTLLVSGNLALLLWTLIATLAVWFYYQVAAWIFLLFATATIWLLLRRIGCSSCYNCKSCTSGFGRLAGWFFGKRELKDLNNKTALAFVIFIYCLLSLIPVALLAISIYQAFSLIQSLVLLCLAAISIYSLTTWRKTRNQQKPKP